MATGTQAAVTSEEGAAYAAMPEGERLRVLVMLAGNGRHDEASALLKSGESFTGPLAANRVLFIEGLISRAQGDLPGAVEKFRAALADNPGLTLVRKELAITLNAMGEDDSAKHHLELLMAEAPDQQAAGSIKSFIDQIDAKQPYKISAFVALAPSTNISGGNNETIYDAFGGAWRGTAAESGIGFSAGVNTGYSRSLGEGISAVFGHGLNGQFYEESAYNRVTMSESAELRRSFLRGHIGFGGIASQSVSGEHYDLSNYSYGPRVTALYRPTPKSSIQSTTTLEFKTYPEAEIYDGYTAGEMLNGTYAFNQATVAFGTLGYEFTNTDSDHLDTDGYVLGLGVYRELPFGVSVTGNTRVRFTDYLGESGYITKAGGIDFNERHDIRYDASVSLTKRDWSMWGYAPEVEYSYSRNDSNFPLNSSESHAVDIRLTKDF